MRQKFAVCFVACTLVLFGAGLLYHINSVRSPDMPQRALPYINLPEEPVQSAFTVGEAEESLEGGGYYVLKTYVDALAVYRVYPDGTRAIVKLLQVHIPALPPYDRDKLNAGIVLHTEEELIKILEDFSS